MYSIHSLIKAFLLSLLTVAKAEALPPLPHKVLENQVYDLSIRKWNAIYNPTLPWWWVKAQIAAESGFNTNAVSPVGAKGLGQFMPATWQSMEQQLGFKGSAFTSSLNIQATHYYMAQLRGQFKKPRPEWDRHSLAMASYNAGLGNILKAQSRGGGGLLYTPMANALPLVTGHHSKETTTYVNRIWGYIRSYDTHYGYDSYSKSKEVWK